MIKHLFLVSLVSLSASASAVELEGTRAPAKTECPSPEEARKKMTVPDGYEVRCFAHEPMIVNPVAMTWDSRGRLWVVEGYEYPNGSEFKNEAFGGEAKDDKYRPVPAICQAKDNPLSAMRADHPKIPKDRIIILEDTDNDGVADKRTVFLEGLDMGSAILCGDGGVYVGQQPHLLHFKDTDGDDHADEWRVVLTGFGREDTHELLNSFCWGPDGWLYMTHGVFTNSKVRRPGVPEKEGFKFDAGIGRCRPVKQTLLSASSQPKEEQTGVSVSPWEFEVFADGTSNPWGCDYDERGNFFVSACVIDHFFHMAPGGIYVRQGGAPENPYSYELLPSIVTHKHFRAAYAGVQIYQGGVYPKDTWGHAFIGNIHDNAIHEEILTPVGSTFKCEPRRDFLRANDGWFRPVSTRTGPDGNLWVMDWCDKYPCYQNAKANPEGVDRDKGRIWRVVTVSKDAKTAALPDHSRPEKTLDLAKLDTPALVKLLEHPNNWMRRMARRELVEKQKNAETVAAIDKLPPSVSLESKLESLFTLHGIGAVDGKLLDKLATNDDAAIRAWAARLTGEIWRTPLMQGKSPASLYEFKIGVDSFQSARERLGHLATDPTLEVRFAVATALRQWSAGCLTVDRPTLIATDLKVGVPIIEGIFALVAADERWKGGPPPIDVFNPADWPPGKLKKRTKGDSSLAFALWQAIEPIVNKPGGSRTVLMPMLAFYDNLAAQSAAGKSFRRACDGGDVKWIETALESVSKSGNTDFILRCLEGLEKGEESGVLKPTKPFSALFAEFAKSENAEVRKHAQNLATLWGDPEAVRLVVAELLNAKSSEAQRLATVQTLRKIHTDEVRAAFEKLLNEATNQPPALLMEVTRAAADQGGEGFKASLTQLASSKNPGVRLAALGALTSRADWTHALLDAIQANKIGSGGFPVSIRRQLATSGDKSIRDHSHKALGAWQESDDNLKALIEAKKKACLEGEPDLAAGKLIFQSTCMVCHTFFGGGQKVGPELIGSGRSNLDAILANVIDPNQIIGNGYEGFIVTTTDNQTLMGRITEDTPSHVKLLAIGGAEQTIERSKIAKLENTHRSLMPVGFGGLPDDQFRNLIWYVLAPPDEGPLTPEKKKLLSTSFDAPANKPKVDKNHAIDWESISLWNPQWKVVAPEFDRTPVKLGEYYGKSNVLLLHPFHDKKTPTVLERKLSVSKAKPMLKFAVAADDRGDWELVVTVDGKAVKKQPVDHEKPRWKEVSVDLSEHAGKEVTVRLEGYPTGWSYEFSYWSDIRMD